MKAGRAIKLVCEGNAWDVVLLLSATGLPWNRQKDPTVQQGV